MVRTALAAVLTAIVIGLSTGCADHDQQRAIWTVGEAKKVVKGFLNDPGSAKWGELDVYHETLGSADVWVVCGTVNAKNGFGGYAGPIRFISNGVEAGTILEQGQTVETLAGAWPKLCTGKSVYHFAALF